MSGKDRCVCVCVFPTSQDSAQIGLKYDLDEIFDYHMQLFIEDQKRKNRGEAKRIVISWLNR